MASSKFIPITFTIATGATESDSKEIQHPVDGAYAVAGLRLNTAITSVAGRIQMSTTDVGADFIDITDTTDTALTFTLATKAYKALPLASYAVVDRFMRIKLAAAASAGTTVTLYLRVV